MSVEGEPTVNSPPVPSKLRYKFYIAQEGALGMLLHFDLPGDNHVDFTIEGQNLETFFLHIREHIEGKGKRPVYLG